jgi:AraC-like DNA-binding protein
MVPRDPFKQGDFFMSRGHPGVMESHHTHHHIEVNYLLSGEMTYQIKGESVHISKNMFTLFWAGLPHQMVARTDDVLMLWIYLPLSWFMSWNLTKNFKGDVLQGGILWDEMLTDTNMIEQWYLDCKSGGELREIAILEIEARIKRMGLKYKKKSQYNDDSISTLTTKVTNICQYISEHLEEEISVDMIAKHINLHPNYMMTIFKKEFGYSINQYLTRLRIANAQRLLVTTDQKILQIAFACGFQTPSRFYSAFHDIVGCSPKAFKKQCLL